VRSLRRAGALHNMCVIAANFPIALEVCIEQLTITTTIIIIIGPFMKGIINSLNRL